jgi:hypothetical protein
MLSIDCITVVPSSLINSKLIVVPVSKHAKLVSENKVIDPEVFIVFLVTPTAGELAEKSEDVFQVPIPNSPGEEDGL